MHLTHVTLPVADPAAVARWYAETLQLDVVTDEPYPTVQAGSTRLTLRPGGAAGAHHLAFDVSPGRFAEARTWLQERARVVARDGVDEFDGPQGWHSRSVYFDGPEESVLELIARRDRTPRDSDGDGADRLLSLSEVGIAVPDVLAAAERLRTELGVPAYAQAPEADFAAVGDVDGLLILVAEGRRWFPTADRYAGPAAIEVCASGGPVGPVSPVGVGAARLRMG